MKQLEEGDIIELVTGMKVYATLPQHFLYDNKKGVFDVYAHGDVTIKGELNFLCGKYIVTHTAQEGGGQGHDGYWPSGHHVYCVNVNDEKTKVDFYQTGCFTAMIKDIAPIGKAKLKWSVGG